MAKVTTRTGARLALILIVIFGLLGPIAPFGPYDWVQQWVSARVNSKPYDGDAVIVSIDEQSLRLIGEPSWSPGALAKLLTAISDADPKQIVIGRQHFGPDNVGREDLREALAALPRKPVLLISAVPQKLEFDIVQSVDQQMERSRFLIESLTPDVAPYVIPANSVTRVTPVGAPLWIAGTAKTGDGYLPSVAQVMADQPGPVPWHYATDQSYDPDTIPIVNGARLLSGDVDLGLLADKRVFITRTGLSLRDNMSTARGLDTLRAVEPILGAKTLIDGPPTMLGWLPAFIAAVLAAVAWTYLRAPYGRLAGLAGLTAIVLSPIVLEDFLVFQETSTGVFLLLCLGAARLWSRYRRALDAAREAAESKSWFLAQASHDLRQPIHAIGMLAARLGQTDMNALQADLVSKISRSVDGAGRMFKSLLDIAALENGSLDPVIVPVSVNQILAEIEELSGLAAERAGVELRLRPSDLVLCTDRALVVTMLQNIVSNAIKYATGKKVLVGARRRGDVVSLCVYDRGQGISQDDLVRVSDRFFRASARSGVEGAGLGLAIVDRLCDLLDLRFTISSRKGRGTGAVISGFRRPDGVVAGQRTPAAPLLPLGDVRILIVDDDVEALLATRDLAEHWGCKASVSETFPERAADCAEIDVVISDFDFGGGHTLADRRTVVADLKARGIHIIVVSGRPTHLVRSAMSDEEMLVLNKPVRPAELRSALMANKVSRNVA